MTTQSNSGRYRIGQYVVELRAPRLADATSWRRTNLENEKRLRPAFGDPTADWDAAHSVTEWAETCWRARTDPTIVQARVLCVDTGSGVQVVGQQDFTGPDPRTGHGEISAWMADLPDSAEVTLWMTVTNVLDAFLANPGLPRLVAPMAVHNRPAIALAEATRFEPVQTLRRLRMFDREPTDHTIWAMDNIPESHAALREVLDSIGAEPLPARKADLPSARAAVGAVRVGARRLRARLNRSSPLDEVDALPSIIRTDDGLALPTRPSGDERFIVDVEGNPVGELQVHTDGGTSTTELIDRLPHDLAPATGRAIMVAACRALVERQNTRRLTVALADRHGAAADALSELGFASEGATWPTLGDEDTARTTWTRLSE